MRGVAKWGEGWGLNVCYFVVVMLESGSVVVIVAVL